MDPAKSSGLSLLQSCYSDSDEDNTENTTESEVRSKTESLSLPISSDIVIPVEQNATLEANLLSNEPQPLRSNDAVTSTVDLQSLSNNPTEWDHKFTVDLGYREAHNGIESDSDTSSESSIEEQKSVIHDFDEEERPPTSTNNFNKVLEDLGIHLLAPLADLKITVPEAECIPIGVVHNVIDLLVIVSAKKGCPAIDLDSVLFLDHGKKVLGQVIDVFGQINEPMYMVRFNSAQHIVDHGVQVGMEVYFAPRTRHTAYVFVDALFKQKGSDASWENDQEPPESCLDYSDDEQERHAKAAYRARRKRPVE